MMTTSRQAKREESNFFLQPIESAETRHALDTLQELFHTSFGPHGRLHLLHNDTGGHVMATACSGRLLHAISASNRVVKLMCTAVQEYLNVYSDGGTFVGLFALELIQNMLSLDTNRNLITEIMAVLSSWCLAALDSDQCPCKWPLSFANTGDLQVLASSIIGAKNSCLLKCHEEPLVSLRPELRDTNGASVHQDDVSYISERVVSAFLKTCSFETPGSSPTFTPVHHVCVEGLAVHHSQLYDGVLFQAPHIPTYKKKPLCLQTVTGGANDGMVRVAMFAVSMSGDSEDYIEGMYELCEDGLELQKPVLSVITDCIQTLILNSVGIVTCQKVVHPRVKHILREAGVMVVDRLGQSVFTALHAFAGGSILRSFVHEVGADDWGYLDGVNHVILADKSYLHFCPRPGVLPRVCTLVLCHTSEQALEELKYVCEAGLHVLRQTVSEPYVLSGGGCWQTWLTQHIDNKAESLGAEESRHLGCTPLQFSAVTSAFISCLHHVVMATDRSDRDHLTDLSNGHHWLGSFDTHTQPDWPAPGTFCQCGMLICEADSTFECLSNHQKVKFVKEESHDHKSEHCAVLLNDRTKRTLSKGDKTENSEGVVNYKKNSNVDTCNLSNSPSSKRTLDAYRQSLNGLATAVSIASMVLNVHHCIKDVN